MRSSFLKSRSVNGTPITPELVRYAMRRAYARAEFPPRSSGTCYRWGMAIEFPCLEQEGWANCRRILERDTSVIPK